MHNMHYIAALGFHHPSSGSMLYQSIRIPHIHVLGWFPSFICFSYFQNFLEQELSFNYDISSPFLLQTQKLYPTSCMYRLYVFSFGILFL